MTEILSVRNVVKRFGSFTALDRVSISVPAGSIYGLLGPNGAGKTTLIRIINHITGPDSGEVLFEGSRSRLRDVEQIGYLPEERGLYKKMEVGEQALYLARLKGLKRNEALKRLKHWFEKFGIQAWWKKKIEELSKGMQQKVQFIVTVLHEPKLLVLDEPFSGFDPINAQLIKDEILDLKKKGTTIIFSTHNMGSVEELCDHIALINRSKTILEGAVSDIRRQFATSVYELEFTGNIIGFTNAMWAGGELLDQSEQEGVHRVKVRLLGRNTTNDLLGAVMPFANIRSLREIIPGMNDIFIAKVKEQDVIGTQSKFTE